MIVPNPHGLTAEIQVLSPALSMAATVALAAFAAWQIHIYQRQTRVMSETLESNRTAVAASGRSAKAAEDVLALTQSTNRNELRAYVGFDLEDPAKSRVSVNVGGRIEVTLPLKNFGQTPAFRVETCSDVGVTDWPPKTNLLNVSEAAGKSRIIINPGQAITYVVTNTTILPPNFFTTAAPENRAIYFKGTIKFLDVFKECRWVKFLMYSHSRGDGPANFCIFESGNETSES